VDTLEIGDTTFAKALLIPELASDLVPVEASLSRYRRNFAQPQATGYNQQTALLTDCSQTQ